MKAREVAEALIQRLYEDEWLDVHQVAALIKVSRSRFDELKALGRFPKPDRWVAGKQIWSRLTVESWKSQQGGDVARVTASEKTLLRTLSNTGTQKSTSRRRSDQHRPNSR